MLANYEDFFLSLFHKSVAALGERLQLALEILALQHQLAVLARSGETSALLACRSVPLGSLIHCVGAMVRSP